MLRRNDILTGLSLLSIVIIHISYIAIKIFDPDIMMWSFIKYLSTSYLLPVYLVLIVIVVLNLITAFKDRKSK